MENLADDEDEDQPTAPEDDPDNDAPADDDASDADDAELSHGSELAAPEGDKQKAIQDYLVKQYGQAADGAGVKDAIENQRRTNMASGIGHALETMARSRSQAVGGGGVDSGFYNGLRQDAAGEVQQAEAERQAKIRDFVTQQQLQRQGVQDTQKAGQVADAHNLNQQKLDQSDPGSRSSQVARAAFKANFPDIAKAMGPDLDGLSVTDLGHISQMTDVNAKIQATKEIAKGRQQAHSDAVAAAAATREAGAQTKVDTANEKQLDKDEKELGAALDPNKARAGLAGDSQKRLNSSARASALIYETNPDGTVQKDQAGKPILKDLNPTLMGEAAQSWANMIGTGGSQADAAVERLVPHTLGGKMASVEEWITGDPHGAGQQAFLKQMADSIERERAVSENLLKSAQAQSASRFTKLKKERPEAWDAGLVAAGVDPKDIDPSGRHNPGWQTKGKQAQVDAAPAAEPKAPAGLPPLSAIDAEIARRKAAASQTAGAK